MVILDTNRISEWLKPNPKVMTWMAGQDGTQPFPTAVTAAERREGIAHLPSGHRRDRMTMATDDILPEEFGGRILPFAEIAFAPIERLNKEVKRRADILGLFPKAASITRLFGAVLFEQYDDWQIASR